MYDEDFTNLLSAQISRFKAIATKSANLPHCHHNFTDQRPIQPNFYRSPNPYSYYPSNSHHYIKEQPNIFDFDCDSLSPAMSNLFMYERIWAPPAKTTTTTTTKETTRSSVIKQTTSSTTTLTNPLAQSTPRPIRKAFKDQVNNKTEFNDYQSEIVNDVVKQQQNGILRPNKPVNCEIQLNCLSNKKNLKKQWNERKFLNTSVNSTASSSPNSSLYGQKKLPLRSKGIDLSCYLNKGSDNGSLCSPGNSELSFGPNKCRNTIQNRCLFCENNGESEEIYTSHPLKDSLGKVVCPILRNFTCPKCGESGDYAHTNKYCPETQRKQKESKIKKFFNQKDY